MGRGYDDSTDGQGRLPSRRPMVRLDDAETVGGRAPCSSSRVCCCSSSAALALYAPYAVLDRRAFADRATAAFAPGRGAGPRSRQRIATARSRPSRSSRRAGRRSRRPSPRRRDWASRARFHAGAGRCTDALFAGGRGRRSRCPAPARSCARRCRRSRAAACCRRRPGALPPRRRAARGRAASRPRRWRGSSPRWARRADPRASCCSSPPALRAPTRRLRSPPRRAGLALAGGAIGRRDHGRARDRALDASTRATATRSSGTIWDAFLGDLRCGGSSRARSGLIAAAVFEPGARGAWRRRRAPAGAVRLGGAARARRRRCSCSPCCCSGCRRFRWISRWWRAPGCSCSAAAAEVVRVSAAR